MLRRAKLKALLGRLGATHRMAVFAERILLVEGPSDETIVTQFAHRLDWPLLARNAQVLPVTGKGEFPEVAKLFRLMGKQVAVLADLDALADDNGLVNHFSGLAGANDVASKRGARSIAELDGDLRNDLSAFITKFRTAISNHIMEYPDWSGEVTADVREKRLALALILVAPTSLCEPARVEAKMLSSRYEVLLEMLGEMGCFFLRAGAIENYFSSRSVESPKPAAAANEAATFEGSDPAALEKQYRDVLQAIAHIAPSRGVIENRVLRPKLAAALSAAFQGMTETTTADELNALSRSTIGLSAGVFKLTNTSANGELRIKVEIDSPIFAREGFPVEISSNENLNVVLPNLLPDE